MDPPPALTDQLLRQAAWTRRLARGLLGDESAAEDVLQETWEAAKRHPPSTDRPVEPWLRTTIRNRLLNRARDDRRRAEREERTVPPAAPDSPEQLLARLEIHKQLVEAVSRLPEPYRQALLLRYFEELDSTQIAERLHVPAATVRGRLMTAVGLLREELDRRPGGRKAWIGMVMVLAGAGKLGQGPLLSLLKGATQGLVAKVVAALSLTIAVTTVALLVNRSPPPPQPESGPMARARPASPPPPRFDTPAENRPEPAPTAMTVAAIPPVAPPQPVQPAPATGANVPWIAGRVRVTAYRSPGPIDMSSDPVCARQPTAVDETILAAGDGGLANAVIRVVGPIGSAAPPDMPPAVIEQVGCVYKPRVLVARVGQQIELRNTDETVHGVRGYQASGSVFSGPLARGDRPLRVVAPAAGEVLHIKCDLHPWMAATVLSTDNPYFAVTDWTGRYRLNLPPGRYQLEAWHEAFFVQRTTVTLNAGGGIPIDFVFGNPGSPRTSNDSNCRLALKGDGPVAMACREGGIKKAKLVMKAMMRKGKQKGLKFECDDCHKDEAAGNWTLDQSAEEKFKKLLSAVGLTDRGQTR